MERSLVFPLLESPSVWFIARLMVTFMYWYAGLGFLLDFQSAIAMMKGEGLPYPELMAMATITVQLLGSLIVIHGRYAWFGAAMLAVFTLATIPIAHDFWSMSGLAATQARLESEEHLSMVGGLIGISVMCHLFDAGRKTTRSGALGRLRERGHIE